ncbi:MAG TPA: 5'-3' exonuclease, partial [Candidatus Limnocylindrales bacterium]|nr:5'-3' exonuclease [Candidatus Limnocylindrales bacterium]
GGERPLHLGHQARVPRAGARVALAERPTLLIDASSLAYRAYHAMPEVRASDGTLVNAVVGFLNFVARLLTDRKPARMVVAFEFGDAWRPDFRVKLIPEYKSHRLATEDTPPDEVGPQIDVIAEVLKALRISVANSEDCEAEDVIATLTQKFKGPIEVVSGDRDLFTLVRDPRILVLYTLRGVSDLAHVDQAWVNAKYGIPGDRYLDYAILRGDPSDGLPGVRGIGEKSASALLTKYGSLDAILAAPDLSAVVRAKLNIGKEYIEAARTVVGPVLDCKVNDVDGSIPTGDPDPKVVELAERYGIVASTSRVIESLRTMSP